MSAHDLICKAFDKGWNAGAADRSRAECSFAPSWQEEKWLAWMIGYEEAYERYAIAMAREARRPKGSGPSGLPSAGRQASPNRPNSSQTG